MIRFPQNNVIIGFLTIMLLSGCATTTQLTSSWKETGVSKDIGKVLVIGKSEKLVVRRQYEDTLVRYLNDKGVNAVSAASILPTGKKLERADIEAAVKEHGFDSVLVTRVTGKDKELAYVPGMTYVAPQGYYNNFYNYYGHGGPIVHEPGYVYTETVVTLETNLYDTRDAKLVWAIATETVNPEKINRDIESIAKLIIEQLKIDGLISAMR